MPQQQSGQCNVCTGAPYERNHYFAGKVLNAGDLAAEQQYFNRKRWLVNRSILGWGIVCGLDVCVEQNGCLAINPGLALDCCGHEILVCNRPMLAASKIAEALGVGPNDATDWIPWGLCLEYRECRSGPVKVPQTCGEQGGHGEYNHIRDDYRLSIRPWKDVCPSDHSDECCAYATLGLETSIHKAVEARARTCPQCKDCDCVLIANGMVTQQAGQAAQIALDPDHWKYRRVVYTNDTLARLFRCFHGALAHITAINWERGKNYRADEFVDLLRQKHLQVTFDAPMNEASVKNPQSLRLTIFLPSDNGGCPTPMLIPVSRVEYANLTAEYYFDETCIDNKLRASCNRLKAPADVELILHGSMVYSATGHALDAELFQRFPTGNGVQGGEFITYFTVGGA